MECLDDGVISERRLIDIGVLYFCRVDELEMKRIDPPTSVGECDRLLSFDLRWDGQDMVLQPQN